MSPLRAIKDQVLEPPPAKDAHLINLVGGGSSSSSSGSNKMTANSSTVASASRKHVELSLELKRKLIQEHEHGVPFTLLGKKYHIATSTAANIWRKKDFFLRSRMSGSRKRCNDRSKYKIVNQVTALFVKSMLERNHKIDGEVIKRFARTAAAQCNFKDFHGSNGWLDSFKKRENVCWVRRRGGERAAIPMGPDGAPGSNQTQGTAANSTSSTPNSSSSASSAAGAANFGCLAGRCDSPNLSTAAAAAAVAATANAQHQHHHAANNNSNNNGAHNNHNGHHNHHHNSNQHHHNHQNNHDLHSQNSHDCWDSESELATSPSCARCSVAAAAAAIAALNSSDSIHERDHEIEDWFHGIPFLCQFFEEYQSMHQQQVDQAAGASGSSTSHNSSMATSTSSQMLAIGSGQTQANGSCCSSGKGSKAFGISARGGSSTSLATTAGTINSSGSRAESGSCIMRSLSDAHELMDTSTFRASASLADIQSLCSGSSSSAASSLGQPQQQQHPHQQHQQTPHQEQLYEIKYDPTAAAAFQQQAFAPNSSSASCELGDAAGDQLMEINFTDEVAGQQQQQQQQDAGSTQMECMLIKSEPNRGGCCQISCATRTGGAEHASASAGSGPCTIISSDYNSDDQEFYLQTTRYIPQDAQSTGDDLLYHDEVSDHTDCCSDHYEHHHHRHHHHSAGAAAHLQDYRSELQGGAGEQAGPTCYMDEYEYENISTIRHYPVPMPAASTAAATTAAAARNNNSASHSANPSSSPDEQQFGAGQQPPSDDTGDRSMLIPRGKQQQQQQQLTFQQQQQLASLECQQSDNRQRLADDNGGRFMTAADMNPSSASSSSATSGAPASDTRSANQLNSAASCQFQETLNSLADCESQYSALVGLHEHEHEQSIEHADHEEHNMLHNALMRSPEKLKLIDSIITLLNYASNYNQKMLAPLLEIKRCIERDLEVVLSDTTNAVSGLGANANANASTNANSDHCRANDTTSRNASSNCSHGNSGNTVASNHNHNSSSSSTTITTTNEGNGNNLPTSGRHNGAGAGNQQATSNSGASGMATGSAGNESRDSLGVVNKLNEQC